VPRLLLAGDLCPSRGGQAMMLGSRALNHGTQGARACSAHPNWCAEST
jgi:hypothetical protein